MKNPFEKNDHKVLIAGIVIGAAAAGAAAYLLLTDHGAELRSELGAQLEKLLGREPEATAATSEPQEEQQS